MAAGDTKKPHVSIDPGQHSPGVLPTRPVGPGEILVDGDGNPIGGSTIIIPVDPSGDLALAEVNTLAETLRSELLQKIQDAFDGAVAMMEASDDEVVDEQEDTALATIEALTVKLHAEITQVGEDALSGAIALVDALRLELAESGSDTESEIAQFEHDISELEQRVTDCFAGAVALIDKLALDVAVAKQHATAVGAALANVQESLQQEISDCFASAVALVDKHTCCDDAYALVDAAAAVAKSDLEEAIDDVFGGTVALVDRSALKLTSAIHTEAGGLVSNAAVGLQAALDQATDSLQAAIAGVEDRLTARVGRLYEDHTTDATPKVIATVTPSLTQTVRILVKIQARRADRRQHAAYTLEALARAVAAWDTLTLSVAIPSDGETVTIDAVTYTWRAAPVAAYDVNIGADIQGSIDNLVAAINLTGTAGVDYGPGTLQHPTVSAVKTSTTTMDAVYKTPGVVGNGIVATETMVNGVWTNGGAGLAGGSDMLVTLFTDDDDVEDDVAWDATMAAGAGQDVEVKVIGKALADIRWLAEVRVIEQP